MKLFCMVPKVKGGVSITLWEVDRGLYHANSIIFPYHQSTHILYLINSKYSTVSDKNTY